MAKRAVHGSHSITIGNHIVGDGHEVFVVAELSGNALGNYARAEALVRAAHDAGADAIKAQCFRASDLTLDSDAPPFRLTWQNTPTTLYELYTQTAMPMSWHTPLKALTNSLGMEYFASVFDEAGVDFLEGIGVPCYKIASFEVVDTPLIRYAASKHRPIIISTGMASDEEMHDAQQAMWDADNYKTIWLKCTSAYPAPPDALNLRTLQAIHFEFCNPVGLSDHSCDPRVPMLAACFGASLIECHITLSRADGGPDAAFSLEPHEFKAMVRGVRVAEQAIGTVQYGPGVAEATNVRFRPSLWVVGDIPAGARFSYDNVKSLRPGDGLPPKCLEDVIGKTAKRDVSRATPVGWEIVNG